MNIELTPEQIEFVERAINSRQYEVMEKIKYHKKTTPSNLKKLEGVVLV